MTSPLDPFRQRLEACLFAKPASASSSAAKLSPNPVFPPESHFQGRVIRWLRVILWHVWDLVIPGSYARAVYERLHDMAIKEFKTDPSVLDPEGEWKMLAARVSLANLEHQHTYAWRILAQSANKVSSVAWFLDQQAQHKVCKKPFSLVMRLLANSHHGDLLLQQPILINLLHSLVPSERDWPYMAYAEPLASEKARSEFWKQVFGQECPNYTLGEFGVQFLSRLSQSVQLLASIVRRHPCVDFDWLCQRLFRSMQPALSNFNRAHSAASGHLAEGLRAGAGGDPQVDWIGLARELQLPVLARALERVTPGEYGLACAVYFSAPKEFDESPEFLAVLTTLVGSSQGWASHHSFIASLIGYLKHWQLTNLELYRLDEFWEGVTGLPPSICASSQEMIAYDLADVILIDKRLNGAHKRLKGQAGWACGIELAAMMDRLRLARARDENRRLPPELEMWLMLIDAYCKTRPHQLPFTREAFYAFVTGQQASAEDLRRLHGEAWIQHVLKAATGSLDATLEGPGEIAPQLPLIEAWACLLDLGLEPSRARAILRSGSRSWHIQGVDLERYVVKTPVKSEELFRGDWPRFHPSSRLLIQDCGSGLTFLPSAQNIAQVQQTILSCCGGRQGQADRVCEYISQLGVYPFCVISHALNHSLAQARQEPQGPILSEHGAYRFELKRSGDDVILQVVVVPSLDHAMKGVVSYTITPRGEVKITSFSFRQS